MPLFANPDDVLRHGLDQATASLPSLTPSELKDSLKNARSFDDLVARLKDDAKLSDDAAHHVAATTVYSILEKVGIHPNEWILTIPPLDRTKLKYGPEQYETARKFLGSWSAIQLAFAVVAVVGSILTIALGIGPAIATVTGASELILNGAAMSEVLAFLNVQKWLSLPRLLIPGIMTAIGTFASYIAGNQITATGDLTTYVRQGIGQSAEKQEQLLRQGANQTTPIAKVPAQTPRTRITASTTTKPTLFLGTLFSSRLKLVDAFSRLVDDQVSSKEELQSDAQTNLNRWLASLPGRLLYTINIANNPFDENGIKQTGMWATMSILIRSISGKTTPIDTILLGPVDPTVYFPTTQQITQVQAELPKLLSAEEVSKIDLPVGNFRLFDKTGNRIPNVLPNTEASAEEKKPPAAAPTPATTPAAAPAAASVPAASPALASVNQNVANIAESASSGFVAQPAPAAVLPVTSSNFAGVMPGGFKIGSVAIVSGPQATTNFRGAPNLTGRIISQEVNGTAFRVRSYAGFADGFDWIDVLRADGQSGFIVASHLKLG